MDSPAIYGSKTTMADVKWSNNFQHTVVIIVEFWYIPESSEELGERSQMLLLHPA